MMLAINRSSQQSSRRRPKCRHKSCDVWSHLPGLGPPGIAGAPLDLDATALGPCTELHMQSVAPAVSLVAAYVWTAIHAATGEHRAETATYAWKAPVEDLGLHCI